MSSEICKKSTTPTKPNIGTKPPSPPPVKPGAVANTVSGKSLRSKHLKIVSEPLHYSLGGNVGSTTITLQGSTIAKDPMREEFFNIYDGNNFLNLRKKTNLILNNFTVVTPSGDEVVYDIDPLKEVIAGNIYTNLLNSGQNQFEYINFLLDVPFDANEMRNNTIQSARPSKNNAGFTGKDPRISTYEFEPRYNLYLKEYEKKASKSPTDVRGLPSAHVYEFLLESLFDLDVKNYDKQYLDFLRYQIDELTLLKYIARRRTNFNGYLEAFISKLPVSLSADKIPPSQRQRFNNLIVTLDDINEYVRASGKFRSDVNYGFYLDFPYDPPRLKAGDLPDFFKAIFKKTNTDLNLYNVVIKTLNAVREFDYNLLMTNDRLVETAFGYGPINIPAPRVQELRNVLPSPEDYYTNLSYIDASTNTPFNFSTTKIELQTWDMTNFFIKYANLFDTFKGDLKDAFNIAKNVESLLIGEANEAIQKYKNNTTYASYQKLMSILADAAFRALKDKLKMPNLAAAFVNLPDTPYEILFYRIEKRDENDNIIQDYYISNPQQIPALSAGTPSFRQIPQGNAKPPVTGKKPPSPLKNELVKFFDTQAIYGKRYSYEVFSYVLAIGKKYHYEIGSKSAGTQAPGAVMGTTFSRDLEEHYLVFDFLKYYFKNIHRVRKEAIKNAPTTEMRKFADQFLQISQQIADEYQRTSVSSGISSRTNSILGPIISNIKSRFLKDLRDILNSYLIDIGADTVLRNQSRNVLQSHLLSYLTMTSPTGNFVPGNWSYSFEKVNNRGIVQNALKVGIREDLATKAKIPNAQVPQPQIDNEYVILQQVWRYIGTEFFNLFNTRTVATYLRNIDDELNRIVRYLGNATGRSVGGTLNPGGALAIDKLKIVSKDYIPLIEVPLFTVSGKILDGPPVAPSISFVPYKDVNNKVMIKLKGENTEYYEVPEYINANEQPIINDMINTRGTDQFGRLLFKTDDYLTKFEIFRTDVRPRSYRDFSGKLIKKVDLEGKYSSYNHYDSIIPNKKYYYTFRSIDQHDHFSNPSAVYEFVLNDDGGFLFPEVNIIEFDDVDYYDFESNIKKYIQIRPSAQNRIFDPELVNSDVASASDLEFTKKTDSNPPLGISDDPVWGKDFKLRITSKTSGKKIDINFTFDKKYIKKDVADFETDPKLPAVVYVPKF